jgi:hypothetical protein
MLKSIASRLPNTENLRLVYSLSALIAYAWMFLAFFYYVPGYIMFLDLWEILGLLSYSVAGALLESLLILFVPLLFALMIPQMRHDFISYGGMIVILWDMWIMLALTLLAVILDQYTLTWMIWLGLIILPVMLSAILIMRAPKFKNLLRGIADRASILLFIFLPASLIGFAIIGIRLIVNWRAGA